MKRTVVLYLRVDEDVKDKLVELAAANNYTQAVMANKLLRKAMRMPEPRLILD